MFYTLWLQIGALVFDGQKGNGGNLQQSMFLPSLIGTFLVMFLVGWFVRSDGGELLAPLRESPKGVPVFMACALFLVLTLYQIVDSLSLSGMEAFMTKDSYASMTPQAWWGGWRMRPWEGRGHRCMVQSKCHGVDVEELRAKSQESEMHVTYH